MKKVFRTEDLPPGDRVDAWRDLICTAFVPFEISGPFPGGFTGEVLTSVYGTIEASDIRSGCQRVRRTRKHIDDTSAAYVKLSVQMHGSCVVSQFGREAVLTPGDLALYDCNRPVQLIFDAPFRQLVFMFPRQLLRLPDASLDGTVAHRISGRQGLGALVNHMLSTLVERCEELPVSAAQHVADSVLDLLVALCTERAGTAPDDGDPLRRSQILQIKAFIEARLADPGLTPDLIAASHHVSTRYLHRLFETEGVSVGRYVRGRRLEHCRRDLVDAREASTPVSVIAARWGFTDPAHFSASFRSAFGLSPREQRAAAFARWRDQRAVDLVVPARPTGSGRVGADRSTASLPTHGLAMS